MASIDDLKNLPTPAPNGWEPGADWDGESGNLRLVTRNQDEPTPEEVNKILDTTPFLSSEEIEVDWSSRPRVSIQHNEAGETTQVWWKLALKKRIDRSFDVQDLIHFIHEPFMAHRKTPGWRTILITDTHLGKGQADGGGSELIARRWLDSVGAALEGGYEGVNLCFGGDLTEGYVSQNGQNISGTDLTLTEQMRVAQHLVTKTIQLALEHAREVVVSVVPGNHGETTRVQNRPMGDSYDIQIISNVQQAFELAGIENVTFYYPEDTRGDVTYTAGGDTFCLVHGHKFRGQMNGAEKWWQGQTINARPAGAADVLLAGHFHNAQIANITERKWVMFGPSLETESTWFANRTGATAKSGVLVFDMVDGVPMNIGVY